MEDQKAKNPFIPIKPRPVSLSNDDLREIKAARRRIEETNRAISGYLDGGVEKVAVESGRERLG